MPPPARVLALGLSEAAWSCIRPFAADLPNLTRMAALGASGVTVAPQPLTLESMWGAVVGGGAPVWRVLESAGIATGTFNLKITARPEAVRGFMVARDERPRAHQALIHPPALYPRLRKQFGAWPAVTEARGRQEWRAVVPREIETRADVLIELLRTRPWRFALAQLPEVSRAQHRFWGADDDTLRTIYAAADRAIGRIIDAAGPETTVFVFSECGAGPVRHGIQLNAWLEQEGYLHRRRGAAPSVARSIARWYKRGARWLVPEAMHRSLLKARARAAVAASDIDWTRTRAHSPVNSGEIVVDGPWHELRARLLALRDPEGRRVVEEVMVSGSRLTIVWDDDAYIAADDFEHRDRVFVQWRPESLDWPFTGSHRRERVLLITGPDIARADLGRVPTTSLVPTWLEMLGIMAPACRAPNSSSPLPPSAPSPQFASL